MPRLRVGLSRTLQRVGRAALSIGLLVVCRRSVSAQTAPAAAQDLAFPGAAATDTAVLRRAMPALARAALSRLRVDDRDTHLNATFRLQMVAEDFSAALTTLRSLRALRRARDPEFASIEYTQYELFALVQLAGASRGARFPAAVRQQFTALQAPLTDLAAYRVGGTFSYDLPAGEVQLRRALAPQRDKSLISLADAVALCRAYHVQLVYGALLPVMAPILRDAERARYAIDESARVPMHDGNVLSAVIVRPRRLTGPQPTVLEFTIYANEQNRAVALEAAAHGFVGIVANSRGKRASAGPVAPWEHDAEDGYDLIDWISRQSWSNGSIGMLGGSYSGFTQWATAKRVHPALKTIVPAAAVAPGIDFPRENGVVLTFQFAWAHYVGNDSLLDDASYRDRARWSALDSTWFARGSAYRALDELDGHSNPLFRRWLDHPTYDAWWQAMIPQGREYAAISIPVLTITGYFDGAQPGALHYLREHVANDPVANHTLLIGPWDHFGSQRRPAPVLGRHAIDPVARVDIIGLVYEWLTHVLRGGPRPTLLADRVNFQVMGTNAWGHVPTLAAMGTDTLSLYLSNELVGTNHRLRTTPAAARFGITLEVDFADRVAVSSTFISTWHDSTLDAANGVVFVGDPLTIPTTVSGAFAGELVATLNVRDVDLGVVLYELTAAGEYIQLSFYLGRASLARDRTRRQLLTPGARSTIPLAGTRVISRLLPAGSRLVAVVNVNKSPQSQLNYGSGVDPSDETIADATSPIRITLHEGSRLRIPVRARD